MKKKAFTKRLEVEEIIVTFFRQRNERNSNVSDQILPAFLFQPI